MMMIRSLVFYKYTADILTEEDTAGGGVSTPGHG